MIEFCINCRRERECVLLKKKVGRVVGGRMRDFLFTEVKCKKCGEEMCPPGLIDLNITEYEEQLRAMGLIVPVANTDKMEFTWNGVKS